MWQPNIAISLGNHLLVPEYQHSGLGRYASLSATWRKSGATP